MTEPTSSRCPSCQAPLLEGDLFCEQCGARSDGAAPPAGDRIELDRHVAAGVSDRGLVHERNEDAFALEVIADGRIAAVVCDGISSASAGDAAARGAAASAAAVLVAALADPPGDPEQVMVDAVAAAHTAVQAVPWTTRVGRGMPSCTLVCALCRDGEVVIGSAGDSRAYWLDDAGVQQLTVDDSWAQARVAEGAMSLEQALADPRSHVITNWIGPDAPEPRPQVVVHRPARAGRLLLCSDGLWNYAADSTRLGELVAALPPGASPAAVARSLADTSVGRGGRDNITVVVVDILPPSGGGADEPVYG